MFTQEIQILGILSIYTIQLKQIQPSFDQIQVIKLMNETTNLILAIQKPVQATPGAQSQQMAQVP